MLNEMMLKEYIKTLRLPAIAQNYKELAEEARTNQLTYEEYLFNLLELEVNEREENRIKKLISQAKFPLKKTLDTFNFEQIPGLNQSKVLGLSRGQYIKDKENVILAGNSGTGNYAKLFVM